jgi:hypothetical protein
MGVSVDDIPTFLGDGWGCVSALHSRYGDIAALRRIINDLKRIRVDLERLEIDASELDLARTGAHHHAGERIAGPDIQRREKSSRT